MAKIQIWDEKKAKKELKDRFERAKEFRRQFEEQWTINASVVYGSEYNNYPNVDPNWLSSVDIGEVDEGTGYFSANYTFKHLRFIHAQLSANPPTVIPRPATSDSDDRRKADAADRLIRHGLRHYKMQEHIDRLSLNTVLFGTGYMEIKWDSLKGDIVSFDEETGEIEMEGDISIEEPNVRHIYLDPDATQREELRWYFREYYMPLEEALFKWPEHKDILKKAVKDSNDDIGRQSSEASKPSNNVCVLCYYEKGMPLNGMLGRFAYCLKDGTVLGEVASNPFKFTPPLNSMELKRKETLEAQGRPYSPPPPTAFLPLHILTDVDVPNHVYGKSFIEWEAPIQDTINRLDNVTLDCAQAHGIPRMILPEGAEIMEDSVTNSPWDIIKITGTQPPFFQEVPTLMPEMTGLRDRLQGAADDMAGVNESMFGQQSREQSGFSMQYATNQGNMIRRRLFNKYAMVVEDIYKSYLNIIRKHWKEPKLILALGREKAFEAVEYKGSDIDGGFDLVVEYGASLSLDPMTRREEILTLQPLFEKAGVDPKTQLSMLKLNELEGMYDRMQLAEDRQRELFEEMIATKLYIEPDDLEDHQGMLHYAYYYVMTVEFKYLEDDAKSLIKQHIRQREELEASKNAPPPLTPGAPGPAPMGPEGALPVPPEMIAAQAEATDIPE